MSVNLESGDETVIVEGKASAGRGEALAQRIADAYNAKYHWDLEAKAGEFFEVRPRVVFGWLCDGSGGIAARSSPRAPRAGGSSEGRCALIDPIGSEESGAESRVHSALEYSAFANESLAPDESADYTRRWLAPSARHGRFGFNWSACFFGSNWCLWRSQYRLAIGVFVAEIAASSTLGVGYTLGRGAVDATDPLLAWLGYPALPIVRFPLGAAANRRISSAPTRWCSPHARSRPPALASSRSGGKGGTSPVALAVGFLLSMAAILWSRLPVG